ncbi:cob(I)alamin adenosyltransferase [Halanaerobium congolense]|jgi:cob(I)alamin adenosyltransferase|uniref:Corrinoid adenosyltransferase n=1 Tax=Halanaerobium congolense TaxID=54121 RepID=A0A1G8J030_9FIRM|nr:cob(I)yrinic acid a,c-diamide adenosyltransferase [Halanaerobium congolense]PUU87153.1 MAG: ATP/cobalamin adenosyltransferase [Halanaerobium sp.]SDI24645.1 cob(I)alamin adenosyltransferase [Halanaerobium congolense]SES67781.1 cob(I)alamin adenosyltransferase [Halanaerobium congolense]
MSIATKRGDKGNTSLLSGERIKKSDPQVEAYGAVDELNSYLGLIRSKSKYSDLNAVIYKIQKDLFIAAAELASLSKKPKEQISDNHLNYIEEKLDLYQEKFDFKGFTVPGESEIGSLFDISRTICRKVERRMVAAEGEDLFYSNTLKSYINRLSDLLYIMARVSDDRNLVEQITEKVLKVLALKGDKNEN